MSMLHLIINIELFLFLSFGRLLLIITCQLVYFLFLPSFSVYFLLVFTEFDGFIRNGHGTRGSFVMSSSRFNRGKTSRKACVIGKA